MDFQNTRTINSNMTYDIMLIIAFYTFHVADKFIYQYINQEHYLLS